LHPDLVEHERKELFRAAHDYDARAARGAVPTIEAFRATTYDGEEFITQSAAYLRKVLAGVEASQHVAAV
jgi:hypothetical protein